MCHYGNDDAGPIFFKLIFQIFTDIWIYDGICGFDIITIYAGQFVIK